MNIQKTGNMKNTTRLIFDELFLRYPALSVCKMQIERAFEALSDVYVRGNKLLVCGNGGSAADSEHIAGELLKQFRKKRKINPEVYEKLGALGDDGEKMRTTLEGSLRAISLTSHLAFSTAFANDCEPQMSFAQQLYGLADKGDALIAISTSGNSQNCVFCAELATVMGVKTIALTGKNQSKLSAVCDITIRVPETQTYKVQELHLPVYHCLCAMLEEELF